MTSTPQIFRALPAGSIRRRAAGVLAQLQRARAKRSWCVMSTMALGDSLAWMPVIDAFREQHQCEPDDVARRRTCSRFIRAGYPQLHFVTQERTRRTGRTMSTRRTTSDFAQALHGPRPSTDRSAREQHAGHHRVHARRAVRGTQAGIWSSPMRRARIPERYVCIATQATAQCKYWNNPRGWPTLIAHLKALGYRVLCIDREQASTGNGKHMNTMPEGCRRLHRRPPATGTREPVAARGFLYRIGKRLVVARVGGRACRWS